MKFPLVLIKLFLLFCFILSLLSSIILVCISAERSNDLIYEVCKKTRNPTLCLQLLKSNSKALKASSPLQLGEISINLSKSSAEATKNTIIMLRIRTRDVELKQRYKSCETNYDSAIYYLKIANYYLKGGDFANVGRYTAAALNEPIYCRESFARAAESTGLKEANDKLECLCSVVLVFLTVYLGGTYPTIELRLR
ncbi:hypothetical protein DH2020_004329 [Rehmannia glutinosa]|uniref:Pectinesterase inhibitor domain-containing protein n=1 Tax=Rehmannia glutinosa TaxID=99300 RepID=A0ABR0XPF7_REHGL